MKKEFERELQVTADGSHTLFVPAMDEHYHSVNGAMQESVHVFIEAGLKQVSKKRLRVLEIGFGTGLNALLTWKETERTDKLIEYYTLERYPLDLELVEGLNYGAMVWPEKENLFATLHNTPWNEPVKLSENFVLHKIKGDSNTCELPEEIDLVYFDAFAPDKQPEMWEQIIFDKLYSHTSDDGIIVTYCAKGEVRRRMQQAGYQMERLPGPPGKRHMLRGIKSL